MNMPGFNAESSIGPSMGIYRQQTLARQDNRAVVPLLPREQRCTTVYSGYITYPMRVATLRISPRE